MRLRFWTNSMAIWQKHQEMGKKDPVATCQKKSATAVCFMSIPIIPKQNEIPRWGDQLFTCLYSSVSARLYTHSRRTSGSRAAAQLGVVSQALFIHRRDDSTHSLQSPSFEEGGLHILGIIRVETVRRSSTEASLSGVSWHYNLDCHVIFSIR